jgi:hypothetical protein
MKGGQIVIATYQYDGLNRRIKARIDAQVPQSGAGDEYCVPDGADREGE